MGRRRREQIVLAVLLVVLAILGYRAWHSTTAPRAGASSPTAAAGRAPRDAQARLEAPDVHLQALDDEPPAPAPGGRDLFRFGARAPEPVGGPGNATTRPFEAPLAPTAGPSTSVLAPIALKFIGIVEAPDSDARIAILSDGRGAPLYGQEGDTIAGRYRIVHIGTESIEMAYLDGRGQQTIRLSGS